MVTERERQCLMRVLRHCDNINRSTGCGTLKDLFFTDREKQESIVFNILQIGELANEFLSDEFKTHEMPGVPWNQIIRMRHLLVHHYDGFSPAIVWDTASEHIPSLASQIADFLHEDSSYKASGSLRKMNLGGKPE